MLHLFRMPILIDDFPCLCVLLPGSGCPGPDAAGQCCRTSGTDELLSVAMDRDLTRLDEKLYLEVFQQAARAKPSAKRK